MTVEGAERLKQELQRLKTIECPSVPRGATLDGAGDSTPAYGALVANGDYSGIYGVDPRLASARSLAMSRTKSPQDRVRAPPTHHTGAGRYPWQAWTPAFAGVARKGMRRISESRH